MGAVPVTPRPYPVMSDQTKLSSNFPVLSLTSAVGMLGLGVGEGWGAD